MNEAPTAQRRASSSATDHATRDRLLESARTHVREHGIATTTSRQIASGAEANLAAITYWFGSKDDLIAEALFGELDRRLAVAIDLLEQEGPAANRLLSAIQELTAEFERSVDEVPVYLDALVAATRPGPLGVRAQALIADLQHRLSTVIAALIEGGTIPGWVDADAMAGLLIATANGIALQTRLAPDGPSQVAMASQLGGLLLAAAPRPTAGTDGTA